MVGGVCRLLLGIVGVLVGCMWVAGIFWCLVAYVL